MKTAMNTMVDTQSQPAIDNTTINVKSHRKASTPGQYLSGLLFAATALLSAPSMANNSDLTYDQADLLEIVDVESLIPDTSADRTAALGAKTQPVVDETVTKVNINLATYEQLLALPGIGKVKATAIIQYRKDFGRFEDIADIQNVKGIGMKMFARLENLIMI